MSHIVTYLTHQSLIDKRLMSLHYIKDWSVTKAILNAMKAIIIDFLCDKIFTNC